MPVEGFVAKVQKAALPGIWSKGVEMSRAGAVVITKRTSAEIEARVRAAGLPVPPTVTLYLSDEEWTCDCVGRTDPCAHVTAATITAARDALNGSEDAGELRRDAQGPDAASLGVSAGPAHGSSTSPPAATLGYRLDVRGGSLVCNRVLVNGGRDEPLGRSLTELLARAPHKVLPTHEDLALERIVLSMPGCVVTPARVAELFRYLGAADIRLRGERVQVDATPIHPRAVVDDAGSGFVLRLERHPSIEAVVARGVARVGSVLRPLAWANRTGEMLEKLPMQRMFDNSEVGELVSRVLPEIEQELEVDVRTTRLPGRTKRLAPRVIFDLASLGEKIGILSTLVYGDPPVARVAGDTLVALGGGVVPMRDRAAESALRVRVRDELGIEVGRRIDKTGFEAQSLVARLASFEIGGDEAIERSRLVPRILGDGDPRIVFAVEEERDTRGKASKGSKRGRQASPEAVIAAYDAGLEYVPLLGGGFARIPEEFLRQNAGRLRDLLAARDEDGRVARGALPALGELCDALASPRPPSVERLKPLVAGLPEVVLPDDLRADLRDYQKEGVRWLTFLRDEKLGGILADDMGLGKTLQCACIFQAKKTSLVVCPKSVLFNWEAELARFRPSLRVARYHGSDRAIDPSADVVLATYAVMRLDIDHLVTKSFATVVFDEAQFLKNPDSLVARAAFRLQADMRIALSGTPIENRLQEIWSLFHATQPGMLGGRHSFRARFEDPIARGDAEATARLRALIAPFLLRRTKAQVLPELPPRTEQTHLVELEAEERTLYNVVLAAAQTHCADLVGAGRGPLEVLEALLRLRQVACHSALVPGQKAASSSKLDALMGLVEDARDAGHRLLVFSQWTSLLDLVEPALANLGVTFDRLDGTTRDRGGVVARFQAADGPTVLLLSLKAGGTGLNLTAADHVVLLDPWWNPAVEDQAADRAHRIGQDRPVVVHRLVAKDTVEERMQELLSRKRALAGAILEGGGQPLSLTTADLAALLT